MNLTPIIDHYTTIRDRDRFTDIVMRAAVATCDTVNSDETVVIQPGVIYRRAEARISERLPHLRAI